MKLQSRLNWLIPVAGAFFYIAREVYEWLKPKKEPFDLKKQLEFCQNYCQYYKQEWEWYVNTHHGKFTDCQRHTCEYYVKTHGGTKEAENE